MLASSVIALEVFFRNSNTKTGKQEHPDRTSGIARMCTGDRVINMLQN